MKDGEWDVDRADAQDSLARSQISLLRRLWWEGLIVRMELAQINVDLALRICPELMPATVYDLMFPHPPKRCDGRPGELSLLCRQPASE